MIRKCDPQDFAQLYAIINDAAEAYRGVIPADRWHEPYMPEEELRQQIADGVVFWGYTEGPDLLGVMGIQDKADVTLIRHAYVRTKARGTGIGGQLLTHLCTLSAVPVLVGTWAAATWAVAFYQKHGFRLLPTAEKDALLRTYWSVPVRQMDTSVVLASPTWTSPATPG